MTKLIGSASLTSTDSGTDLTTKGDVHGYSTSNTRIPVGANDTVLTADSSEALRVKWATPSSGAPTLTRTNYTSATQISTTSTSLVDMSFTSHTVANVTGNAVCLFTGEFDVSAGGFLAFDFSVDGTQSETWIGKPEGETIHSSTSSITDTLGGQDLVVQYRASSGTVIAQSDGGYNGVADYLEIS